MGQPIAELLLASPGTVDLSAIDTRSTPGFDGKKAAAKKLQPALAERIAVLQEQLYAEGRNGGTRSVLLVLQGMDTSGKGGTVEARGRPGRPRRRARGRVPQPDARGARA